MSKRVILNTITIIAPIEKVWDALVNPEQTRKYMFGCETVSGWNVGDPLLWKGSHEGKEMIFVSGYILDIQPHKLLKYSVIDPNATYPHTPENHLNVTYQLSNIGGVTTLKVSQDGFEAAADGEKRYIDVHNNGEGWDPILTEIKRMIESGSN